MPFSIAGNFTVTVVPASAPVAIRLHTLLLIDGGGSGVDLGPARWSGQRTRAGSGGDEYQSIARSHPAGTFTDSEVALPVVAAPATKAIGGAEAMDTGCWTVP